MQQTKYTSEDENAIKSAVFSLQRVEMKSVELRVAIHDIEKLLALHQCQELKEVS